MKDERIIFLKMGYLIFMKISKLLNLKYIKNSI